MSSFEGCVPICGIVASRGRFDEDECRVMLSRLTHRGPDDDGIEHVGGTWLGHRRLSIVDVSGGGQPLWNAGRSLAMVGNGEIYNHREIRADLPPREYRTGSDNEAVLALFEERGAGAVADLVGMYAVVIAGTDGRFLAARDPVGIKPLYWAERRGTQVFASELRAYPPPWREHVREFPPGHYWTPESGLVRFATLDRPAPAKALERLPAAPSSPAPGDVLAAIRDAVVAAVDRRMMADVPVGVFLSGGLDSSVIAAIAARDARRRGDRLLSFAVGTPDSPDLAAARRVADHLGTEHHERVYTAGEAVDALPAVIRATESFEPSLVRSAVPNFFLAELAARHVKVVLTGEGADELFAGYEYLRAIDEPDALHDELVRTLSGLHNLNLQRADRVTMAHGLEARVPFLDLDVIGVGLALPAAWKVPTDDGRMEKQVLREAFTGWVPDDILWRTKAQFDDGSGATEVLQRAIAETVTAEELELERVLRTPAPRSREELAYQRIFEQEFAGIDAGAVLGRFATA